MNWRSFGVALPIALPLCGPALGDGIKGGDDTDYLSLQAGMWGVSGGGGENTAAAMVGLEYRAGIHVWLLHPFAGVAGNSRGGIFGYAGAFADVPLTERFYFNLSAAIGAYRRGSGKDLGGVFEFRLGVEIGYSLESQARLGVRLEHISNANTHSSNPGIESVLFTYSVPLSQLYPR